MKVKKEIESQGKGKEKDNMRRPKKSDYEWRKGKRAPTCNELVEENGQRKHSKCHKNRKKRKEEGNSGIL